MHSRTFSALTAMALPLVQAGAGIPECHATPPPPSVSPAPPPVAPAQPPARVPPRAAPQPDRNRAFVERLYQDTLGRSADANAIAQLTTMLRQGSARDAVAQVVLNTDEYRTARVKDLYSRLLRRAPDPQGAASMIAFLRGGGTEEQVASMLLASDEYFQLAGATNAGFVERLYTDLLGRPVDSAARTQFAGMLDRGAATRATVAQLVLGTDEYARDTIGAAYQKYLRRAADASAQQAFRSVFQQGGSRAVAVALLASPEYYDRV